MNNLHVKQSLLTKIIQVKVPKNHIIGKVNQGFKYIMHNFNHERLGIVMQANRLARVCIEESLKVKLNLSYYYLSNFTNIQKLVLFEEKDLWSKFDRTRCDQKQIRSYDSSS